ncbi:MAG: hypothetical protein HRU17_06255 [Polyangiaceae bacterium]|nr:hypothetical protein [Polyangiaceae bacterium]
MFKMTTRAATGLLISAIFWLPGCAGNSNDIQQRLDKVQSALTKLQNDYARMEQRIAEGETSQLAKAVEPVGKRGRQLKVIRLEPEPDSEAAQLSKPPIVDEQAVRADETDDEPRVIIRGRGQRVVKSRSKSARAKTGKRGSTS